MGEVAAVTAATVWTLMKHTTPFVSLLYSKSSYVLAHSWAEQGIGVQTHITTPVLPAAAAAAAATTS